MPCFGQLDEFEIGFYWTGLYCDWVCWVGWDGVGQVLGADDPLEPNQKFLKDYNLYEVFDRTTTGVPIVIIPSDFAILAIYPFSADSNPTVALSV